VHQGRSTPGPFGDLVCFAGRGPGEVFQRGRKVVGLSQWRSREGALFSSCAYQRWDPAPLVALMDAGAGAGAGEDADGGEAKRGDLARRLAPVASGLAELEPPLADLGRVRGALLDSLADFAVTGRPAG
jgi:lipoate---protein ligase